ncbi:MAG: hypothetical protein HUU26_03430 [Gemmatimonadaceae bacterium]|nr:hypothetical protein [Gemmatimonadaceae bacterium]
MTLIWSHTDTNPAAVVPDMFRVAKSGAWASIAQPTRTRYMRMLVALTLQAGLMKASPPRPEGPEGRIQYDVYRPDMYLDRASLEIGSTLLRTLLMIVPPGQYAVQSVRTEDGNEPVLHGPIGVFEAGAFPLVLWVVGAAACTLVSVVVAKVAGDVIDRELARREDTRKLVAAQAAAVQVVLNHLEREDRQGARIPYDDMEMTLLESLLKTQRKIAEQRQAPLPTPFAGAAQSLDTAISKVGSGLGAIVPIAVAGGILFLIWSRK